MSTLFPKEEEMKKITRCLFCLRVFDGVWRFSTPEELHALAELEVGVNSSRCPTCTNMYMLSMPFRQVKADG
ncbi:MAG: hypothetical protein AAB687_00445 [Patescibacteria group bacterium]